MMLNARWQFVLVYTAPEEWKRRAVRDVSRGIAEGVVTVGEEHGVPLHHFGLEDAAGAHAAVESGAVGKVIVSLGE